MVAVPAGILHLAQLAGDTGARSLAAGVPLLAAVWAHGIRRWRGPAVGGAGIASVLAATLLLIGCAAALWCWPVDETNDHQYFRPDLLLLGPTAAGVVMLLAGARALPHLLPPLLLLPACWPPLLEGISRLTTPAALAWTEWAGQLLVGPLPVTVTSDVQPHVFHCTGAAGTYALTVADPCSGTGGLLAVALVLPPLLHLSLGSWSRRLALLGAALGGLALLTALRFAVLCWIAGTWGPQEVFTWFHLLGGTGFHLLLWLLLLAMAVLLGLHPRPVCRPPASPATPVRRRRWPVLLLLLVLVAANGVAGWRLMQRWAGLRRPTAPAVDLPGHGLGDLLPVPAGFDRWHHRSLDWTHELFGPGSQIERFGYRPTTDGDIRWVDVLLVDDFATLERHTVIGCYRWHDAVWHERRLFELGPGLPASYLDVTDDDGRRWRVVVWIQAVRLASRERWRQVVVRVRVTGDAAEGPEALREFAGRLAGG
jgi:exosortase/archaeosortase family protein